MSLTASGGFLALGARKVLAVLVSALMVAATMLGFGAVEAAPASAEPVAPAATQLFNESFTDATLSDPNAVYKPAVVPIPGRDGANPACLTASGDLLGTPIPGCSDPALDADGSGVLRLTPTEEWRIGGVLTSSPVPSAGVLDASFTTYQWRPTLPEEGGDSMAFVLAAVDPQAQVPPAATGPAGAGAGYAPRPLEPTGALYGLDNAYLGIALDKYGGFTEPYVDGAGCTTPGAGVQANQLAVRGPGNGPAGYCVLASTGADAVQLQGTSRANAAVPMRVTLNPTASTVDLGGGITVPAGEYRIAVTGIGQAEQALTGALPDARGTYASDSWLDANGVPKQLVLGWTASTGGFLNNYEISNAVFNAVNPLPVLSTDLAYSPTVGSAVGTGTYSLTTSVAAADLESNLTVRGELSADFSPGGANIPSGWSCSSAGNSFDCTYAASPASPITAGTTLPTITWAVTPVGSLTRSDIVSGLSARTLSDTAQGAFTDVTSAPDVPAAPTVTSVTPSDGAATVAFTAGADGGTALTNYEYSTDGGATWTAVSPATTASPITITGLSNGVTYSVGLRALNSMGAGATSNLEDVRPVPGISLGGGDILFGTTTNSTVKVNAQLPAGSEVAASGFGTDFVRVTVTASAGSVSLLTSANVSAPAGYPANFSGPSIALVGTQANVNTALDNLVYTAGDTTDPATITFDAVFSGNDSVQYNPNNGNYYQRTFSTSDFATARTTALAQRYQTLGGYLATITSAKEQQFLEDNGLLLDFPLVFLGGTDDTATGNWEWLDGPEAGVTFAWPDGSSFGGAYVNWDPGEPTNTLGENALCAFVGWHDCFVTDVRPSVIEYSTADGAPDPALSTSRTLTVTPSAPTAALGGIAVGWGANGSGQLGNDSTVSSSLPVAVDTTGVLAGKRVTQVGTSFNHSCALADGDVFCWGANGAGQLGTGNRTSSNVPVALASQPWGEAVVTDMVLGEVNTCVIADGRAYCWGSNFEGRLGNNSFVIDSMEPVAVDTSGVLDGKTVTDITVGTAACVVADGEAFCWGYNNEGQLGNGNTGTSQRVPVAVDSSGVLAGRTVSQVESAGFSTCAVADGQAFCWGLNNVGQLGNSSTTSSNVPVAVTTSTGLGGKVVTDISVGFGKANGVETQGSFACAVADGNPFCWGNNSYGQLGTGNTDSQLFPSAVTGLAVGTVTDISTSAYSLIVEQGFTCAVSSARAYCWGSNDDGQLGNGNTTASVTPTLVAPTGEDPFHAAPIASVAAYSGFVMSVVQTATAPTIDTATAGDGSVEVVYTAPSNDGGAAIVGYEYTTNGGATWVNAGEPYASPLTISGLTNGVTYDIGLRALTAAGPGSTSNLVEATPLGVPAAPTSLVATPGDETASIAFTAGSDGGSAITDYEYRVRTSEVAGEPPTPAGEWGAWTSAGTTASPVDITGLTNGTAYDVELRAVSALGDGASSAPVSVTPRTTPSAPTDLAADANGVSGQLELSFTPGSDGGSAITDYEYQVGSGSPAEFDAAFDTNASAANINNWVFALALQSDGKILAGGAFTAPGSRLARFNADGSLDAEFGANVGSRLDARVLSVAVQPDGKILVGGDSTGRLVRLKSDGTPDTDFNSEVGAQLDGSVYSVAVEPDGQIVVGGNFAGRLARFNSDGTADAGFNGNAQGLLDRQVRSVKIEADGQIVVGGEFSAAGGSPSTSLARFNSDGTPDAEFNDTVGTTLNNQAYIVAIESDGQILVGGRFTSVSNGLARFNPDGSADTTFNANVGVNPSAPGDIYGLAVDAFGRIIIAGQKTAPSRYVSIFGPDGVPDAAFNDALGSSLGNPAFPVVVQDDGWFVVGGIALLARVNPGPGPWTSAGATASPFTIGGLTNGSTYDVSVRAVNAAGVGAVAGPVEGTPLTAPSAPTALVATRGDTAASIAFTPGDDGGSPVTDYEYRVRTAAGPGEWGDWTSAATTASPVDITGLTNGTTYDVELRAVNAVGDGAASASVEVTPAGLPAAPTALVATSGNESASVAFTPGDDGGSPVTDYEYRARTAAEPGEWGDWTSAATTTSPVSVTDLTNGTAYDIEIRAINTVGEGDPSEPVEVIPRTTPDAPTDLAATATGSSGELEVTFTPGGDGGSPITDYEYQTTDPAGTSPWTSAGVRASPFTISGLSDATTYGVSVRAVNAAGAGAVAGPVEATPFGLPGAPTGVEVVPGDGIATLGFTPGTAGSSATTNYQYQLDGGAWVAFDPVTPEPPVTITNLTNGTRYSIKLRAVTADGESPASAAVSVIPTVPNQTPVRRIDLTGEPTFLGRGVVQLADGSLAVTDPGANAIAVYAPGAAGDADPTRIITGGMQSPYGLATFTSEGVEYLAAASIEGDSISVFRADASGESTPVRVIAGAATLLNQPFGLGAATDGTLVAVQPNSDSVLVFAPGATGDVPPARVIAGDNTELDTPVDAAVLPDGQIAVTSLAIQAILVFPADANGDAAPVRAIIGGATGLFFPFGLAASPSGFLAAANLIGDSVTVFAPGATGDVAPVRVIAGAATQMVAPGDVTWMSDGSMAVATGNLDLLVYGDPIAPGAPTITSWSPTNNPGEVSIAFEPPAAPGGTPILDYEYRVAGGEWVSAGTDESPVLVTGLTDALGTPVAIRAVNAIGEGLASDPVAVTAGVPSAPLGVVATPGDSGAAVMFTAPEFDGGSAVTNYEYRVRTAAVGEVPPGEWSAWVASSPPWTFSPLPVAGLTNGVTYDIEVRADNANGSGLSASAGPVTPSGGVDVPTGVVGVLTDVAGDVEVSWTAPVSSGGVPVTSYEVLAFEVAGPEPSPSPSVSPTSSPTVSPSPSSTDDPPEPTPTPSPSSTDDPPEPTPTPSPTVSPSPAGSCMYEVPVLVEGAPELSCVVDGLTLGKSYVFTVTAMNVAGSVSDPSAASAAVLVEGPAGAPTELVATAGDASASIAFTAPTDAGGGTISDYEYRVRTSEVAGEPVTPAGEWGAWTSAGTDESPVVVTGLVNGTAYDVELRAVNGFPGGGTASEAVTVTPRTVPGAPVITSMTVGDASVVVWFTAAAANGSAVTNYEYSLDGGSSWATFEPVQDASPVTITGLVNGQLYDIALRGVNAAGAGAASNVVTVSPFTVPAAPTDLEATPGNQQIEVEFTAPASTGSVSIMNYQFTTDGGTSWATFEPVQDASPVTITAPSSDSEAALVNGQTYDVALKAVNDRGAVSVSSASVGVVPFGKPQAPGGVVGSAGPGVGQVTVSWDALVNAPDVAPNNNGALVSQYAGLVYSGATFVGQCRASGQDATSCVVSGLTPGSYTVLVRARNAAGWGPSGVGAAPVSPAQVAGAPTVVSVVAGDGQVVVGFTAPADSGGVPVTNYQYTIDGGVSWVTPDPAVTASPLTVTGLTNGDSYSVGVRAVTSAGAGAASSPLVAVVPRTVPGAPSVTSVSPGDQQISVVFTAPDDGGAAISNYEYSIDGGESWVTPDPVSTSSPLVIDGVINGTAYGVALRAVNVAGAGAASDVTEGVVPFGKPQAPGNVAGAPVAGGAGQVRISWDALVNAPSVDPDNNGAVVSQYAGLVYSGATFVGQCRASGQESTGCVVSGLTPGVSYTVLVRARNAAGWGPSGVGGTPVAPFGVPGAPAITTTNPGDASFAVGFTAAAANGAAITNYQFSTDGGATWRSLSPPVSGAGPFAVIITRTSTGAALVNGTTYQVQLRAVNSYGPGAATASTAVTLPALPGAPVLTAAVPTNTSGEVSVAFDAPTDLGVPEVSNYQFSTDDGLTWQTRSPAATDSPLVIDGLMDGQEYQVKLRAVNTKGAGPASNMLTVTPRTTPGAPAITTITEGDQQLSVVFTAPEDDGGAEITNYAYSTDDGANWVVLDPASTVSPIVITSLVNGTEYVVRVRAINPAGQGTASDAVAGTPRTTPDAPGDLTVGPNEMSGQLLVTFTAPADDGGSAITMYEYRLDGGSWIPGSDSPLTLAGLTNGTEYEVEIRAVNAAGGGTPAGPVSGTPRTVPSAPQGLTATHGDASAVLSFGVPADDGGAGIDGYEYSTNDGVDWLVLATTGSAPVTATITTTSTGDPLVNGDLYEVRVRAVNAAGEGASASASFTPSTRPAAPTVEEVIEGDEQLAVSWAAPDDGGAMITSYLAIAYDSDGIVAATCRVTGAPAATGCTITGLINGQEYTVAVRATNLNGQGPQNTPVGPYTPNPLAPPPPP